MNSHISFNQEHASVARDCSVLWVPGERVVVWQVPRPKAPKRKWPGILPWVLEDRLLQPVESMHFVSFDSGSAEDIVVLTASQSDMKHWLALAAENGLRNFRMLPDYLALPWQQNSISIADRGDLLLVRTSLAQGFAAPKAMAIELLLKLTEKSEQTLHLAAPLKLDLLPASLQTKAQVRHWQLDWQTSALQPPLAGLNLLVDTFSQKPEFYSRKLVRRVLPAMLVLLLAVTGMTYLHHSTQQLEQERIAAIDQQQAALVLQQENLVQQISTDGSLHVSEPVASKQDRQLAQARIAATLVGVLITPEQSSATIAVAGKPEANYHVGDELARGVEILQISADRIVIREQGNERQIPFKSFSTQDNITASSGSSEALELPGMFANLPVQLERAAEGVRISSLSEELKARADIQDGDVITRIGDKDIQQLLTDPAQWAAYSMNTELPVKLLRGGQELTVYVNALGFLASQLPTPANASSQ